MPSPPLIGENRTRKKTDLVNKKAISHRHLRALSQQGERRCHARRVDKDLITIVTPRSFARGASGGAKKDQQTTENKDKRKPGRPRTPEAIRERILQMYVAWITANPDDP